VHTIPEARRVFACGTCTSLKILVTNKAYVCCRRIVDEIMMLAQHLDRSISVRLLLSGRMAVAHSLVFEVIQLAPK
jgi:hypothetical protein